MLQLQFIYALKFGDYDEAKQIIFNNRNFTISYDNFKSIMQPPESLCQCQLVYRFTEFKPILIWMLNQLKHTKVVEINSIYLAHICGEEQFQTNQSNNKYYFANLGLLLVDKICL